ncbi:MAG: gliding motility-associated C-terminal domain-containing protein [Flavobacteriales bacterium]|nr:gliding motility-associated C-terminal domain-containing protein [Flavobacteriales bacterium]
MNRSLLLSGSLLLALLAEAQVPTQCLEVERILVDACISSADCPGSQEGQNEMVRFRVGPQPIALADLEVDWPNNSFLGLAQNSSTAAVTAALNATITACGQLLEPPGGIIPAGASVLLITSPEMCTAANSFAGLADTLYVIYQAVGNSAGHFANHNNGGNVSPVPVGGIALRTLVIGVQGSGCADTVTYDRQLLVNTFGTYGGTSAENDGATVAFSWPGPPQATYSNPGCQAPVVATTVVASSGSGTVCPGGTVALTATVTGPYSTLQWSGGTGSFSAPNDSISVYTLGPGDAGTVTLTFCAAGGCGQGVCDTVQLQVGTGPAVSISGGGALCPGSTMMLFASGADTYVWSTGDIGPSLLIGTPGTYAVVGTGPCGQSSDTVVVAPVPPLQVSITGDTVLCPGESIVLTATPGVTYQWNNGASTQGITVDVPGPYFVTVSNGCTSGMAYTAVTEVALAVAFTAAPATGTAPLNVAFSNTSTPASAAWAWDFGDGTGSASAAPAHLFTDPGSYTVTLTGTLDGCTDQAQLTVVVQSAPEGPPSITIPNVFSPNGDGVNDGFVVLSEGIRSLRVLVYNRWGQEVGSLEGRLEPWDGRTKSGQQVPEGTYFYVLEAEAVDGTALSRSGTLTLVR